jgi:hypothetical protein
MPSRDRHTETERAIRSVFDNCDDSNNIEIIVRLDDDDQKSQVLIDNLQKIYKELKVIVKERGIGYGNLHHYYNDAMSLARGDYFHIWGNDNEMKTPKWDKKIQEKLSNATKQPFVIWPHKGPKYPHFPCISKKFFDILGQFPDYPFIDTYVLYVTNYCIDVHGLKEFEMLSGIEFSHKEIRDHLWPGHNRNFKHLTKEEIQNLTKNHAKFISDKIRENCNH